jgi:hypothetical protein
MTFGSSLTSPSKAPRSNALHARYQETETGCSGGGALSNRAIDDRLLNTILVVTSGSVLVQPSDCSNAGAVPMTTSC